MIDTSIIFMRKLFSEFLLKIILERKNTRFKMKPRAYSGLVSYQLWKKTFAKAYYSLIHVDWTWISYEQLRL